MKSESEVSCVRLLATPWTAAYQASPSMGFSRQECWSVVPLPSLEYTSTLLHIRKNTLLLLQYYIFLKNLTKSFLLCKQLASTIFIILKVSYWECYFKPFYDKKKNWFRLVNGILLNAMKLMVICIFHRRLKYTLISDQKMPVLEGKIICAITTKPAHIPTHSHSTLHFVLGQLFYSSLCNAS